MIVSGKSSKITVILISSFSSSLANLFTSFESIFIVPLPSLKKISRASSIDDLPISFLPTNVVKLPNSKIVSSL